MATKEKLTVRERIGVTVLIMILKIVSPWQYSHEFSKHIEAIEKEMKLEA